MQVQWSGEGNRQVLAYKSITLIGCIYTLGSLEEMNQAMEDIESQDQLAKLGKKNCIGKLGYMEPVWCLSYPVFS